MAAVAIPMGVAPRTPRRRSAHFTMGKRAPGTGGGGMGVCGGIALATKVAADEGGRLLPIISSRPDRGEKEGQHTQHFWTRAKHTHTQASKHGAGGGKAHAHLCVVALLGGWLLLALSGGRHESGMPPTFVSVRSVVTDLSTCVAYVSAHLKHTCVNLTITVPF